MLSNFPKVTQRELAEQELPSEETVLAACVQTEQEKRRAPLAGPRGAEWGATAAAAHATSRPRPGGAAVHGPAFGLGRVIPSSPASWRTPSCLCDRKVELRDRTVESNEGTFWRIMAAVRLKERETVYSNNTCIICFQKIWQESAFVFQFHSQKEKKAKPHDTRKAALARVF